jgi:hypothetical protein
MLRAYSTPLRSLPLPDVTKSQGYACATCAASEAEGECRRCAEPPCSSRLRAFVSTFSDHHYSRRTSPFVTLDLFYPSEAHRIVSERVRNVALASRRRLISLFEDVYALAVADHTV